MAAKKKYGIRLDAPPDHAVLAIASHEKIYRLAWRLNQTFGAALTATDPYTVKRKDEELSFPLFRWYDELKMVTWHLMANRSAEGYFLPSLRNVDFFLLLAPAPEDASVHEIITSLRQIDLVITAFSIDLSQYRSLRDLVLE